MGYFLTLVYIVFVFLRPQEVYTVLMPYRVMDVLAAIAAAATAFSVTTGAPKPLLGGPEWRFGVAFIFWCAFSVAAAIRWFGGAFTVLINLSIPLFMFVLVIVNVTTRRRLVALVVIVWSCVLILLGLAFHAYYSDVEKSQFFIKQAARGGIDELVDAGAPTTEEGDEQPGPDGELPPRMIKRIQATGFLADPNDFAQCLICLVPLLGLAWRRKRPLRNTVLVLLPAAAASWGVLLTRSRGGLVASLAMVVTVLIYRLDQRRRRPVGMAVIVLAIPAFVALFGYAKADASAASRLEAWGTGLQMLKWYPIWGVGYGQFTEHHERVAHSTYVQCFAETGLVGYFLWLGLLSVSMTRVSRIADSPEDSEWRDWARMLRLSMIGFLFGALFLSRTTSPMLFFLISLLAVLSSMAQRAGQPLNIGRHWWLVVLAIEFLSVTLVWITARASH